jgi:toxin ParE1/3/4
MHRLIWRPKAIEDLRRIADWTEERHGRVQAQHYTDKIVSDIESLQVFPLRHSAHSSRHGAFRKMRSGQHLIFYLVLVEAIDLARILHARMDFDPELE